MIELEYYGQHPNSSVVGPGGRRFTVMGKSGPGGQAQPVGPLRVTLNKHGKARQLAGDFKMTNPEREFAESLLSEHPHLHLYRTRRTEVGEGDFLIVDMSRTPAQAQRFGRRVYGIEHKTSGESGAKQLQSAAERAAGRLGFDKVKYERLEATSTEDILRLFGE